MIDYNTQQRRKWLGAMELERRAHRRELRRYLAGALLLSFLFVGWCEW